MRKASRCLSLLLALFLTLSWIPAAADTVTDPASADSNEVTLIDLNFDNGETFGMKQVAGKKPLTEKNEDGALRLTDNNSWGIWELAAAEQLKGARSFTLSAKIRMDTFSAKGAHAAIRLNQSADASGASINGATVIQLYQTASDILLIGGNRGSGGWVASGDGCKKQTSVKALVTEGDWFGLELTVDQAAKTCTVTLTKGDRSISQTYEHITDAESNLSLVFEKQSSLWDDLKLSAVYAAPVDFLGV